jgi:hypothetical protein
MITKLEQYREISRGSGILFLGLKCRSPLGPTATASTVSSIRSGRSENIKNCRILIAFCLWLSGMESKIRAYVSSNVFGNEASALVSNS